MRSRLKLFITQGRNEASTRGRETFYHLFRKFRAAQPRLRIYVKAKTAAPDYSLPICCKTFSKRHWVRCAQIVPRRRHILTGEVDIFRLNSSHIKGIGRRDAVLLCARAHWRTVLPANSESERTTLNLAKMFYEGASQ